MLQLLISGIVVGSSLVLITSGFAIIYATTKTFHIAHGLTYALAAYIAYYINAPPYNLPLWLAAVLVVPVAATAGILMERLVYAPLRNVGASELAIFIASFGLLLAGLAALQMIWGSTLLTYRISAERPSFRLMSVAVTDLQAGIVATALLSFIVLMWIDRRTNFGLAIKCVASNRERATLLGIKVQRVHYWAFGLGSALIVPGALLDGSRYGLDPGQGLQIILLAMVAQLIGGVGNLVSGVLASYLIGLAGTLPLQLIDPKWQNFVVFGVLFAVLLLRPQGLFAGNLIRRFGVTPTA